MLYSEDFEIFFGLLRKNELYVYWIHYGAFILLLLTPLPIDSSTYTLGLGMYSRLRNKHKGMLINFWTFFQGLCSLLERVMHML